VLFVGEGRGAWNNWSYEVLVTSLEQNMTLTNVTETAMIIESLQESTLYDFYVRGYSVAGYGPWSRAFSSKTMHSG